jgi:periplasmic protein TonB
MPNLCSMYRAHSPADRARAWGLTAVATAGLGYLIVTGLAMTPERAVQRSLDLFTVTPPPPPPPERVVPERVPSRKTAGEAAPPNLRATPKEVTAPEPIVPPPLPPPVLAPPIAATGPDVSSGATDRPGPGTGAGGIGNGRGAGGDGDGTGSGYGLEETPRLIRRRISMRDYPEALVEAGVNTEVGLRFTVQPNGRVTDCRVTRSSGYPAVDALTCREVERGYLYRPWRDADGQPVRSVVLHDFEWIVDE